VKFTDESAPEEEWSRTFGELQKHSGLHNLVGYDIMIKLSCPKNRSTLSATARIKT
jgi:hypothetical protein